ncbi:cyclin-T1-5-like [Olea europaea var. sylvestris]|nr:cyclin-T1-5-like [Olea europaea var. sylvestris]
MLELYEQNRIPPSQASEAEGSAGGSQRPPSKAPVKEEHVTSHNNSHGVVATSKAGTSKAALARPFPEPSHADNHGGLPRTTHTQDNDRGNIEMKSIQDHEGDDNINVSQHHQREREILDEDRGESFGRTDTRDTVELKDKYSSRNLAHKDGTVSQSPQDAIKKIDKEKVKAALERRKARGDMNRKTDPMDELERELEDVELPGESEKIKRDRKQSWSKPSDKSEHEKYRRASGDGHADDFHSVEEGEVEPFDDVDRGYQSVTEVSRS